MTPTSRSLAVLRKLGYEADVVERWIPGAKIRKDYLGCIDLIACHETYGILGVQATTTDNASKREAKAKAEPRLRTWLAAGATFEVWGWALRGAAGKRKLWTLSKRRIGLEALEDAG